MLLIVELVVLWTVLSLVVGLPLGRVIGRADAREYPFRESPWWCDGSDGARDADPSAVRAGAGAFAV